MESEKERESVCAYICSPICFFRIDVDDEDNDDDVAEALEKQRQMYERQMQMLRNQLMSPGTPTFPLQLFDPQRLTPTATTANSIQRKYQLWAQDR